MWWLCGHTSTSRGCLIEEGQGGDETRLQGALTDLIGQGTELAGDVTAAAEGLGLIYNIFLS